MLELLEAVTSNYFRGSNNLMQVIDLKILCGQSKTRIHHPTVLFGLIDVFCERKYSNNSIPKIEQTEVGHNK